MYTYYVIYRAEDRTTPTGVFVRQQGEGHDLIWDHRAKAWVYDPDLVARFLGNYDKRIATGRWTGRRRNGLRRRSPAGRGSRTRRRSPGYSAGRREVRPPPD